MKVLDTVPPAAQAKVLRAILAAPYPKLAMGAIAASHSLTMEQLQTIARHHGYPNRDALQNAATVLEQPPIHDAGDSPVTTATPTETGLRMVRLDDLHTDPKNIRERLGDVTELADSIVAVGLLQPIVARIQGDRLVVVAGHRRLAAVRHLGWAEVDTIVRPPMAPDDVLAAMIIENSQRRDLNPVEEARGLARLAVDMGTSSHAELAARIGRTQSHVSGRLALLNLAPEDQEQLLNGELSLGAAVSKGRADSGRVRPGAHGKKSAAHLSVHHDLASRAQARCTQLKHKRNGSASVGGVACGACWESVIRADERSSLHHRSAQAGSCVLCEAPLPSREVG